VRKTGPIKQPKRNMGVIQMEKTMIDHGILWNSPFRQTSIYIYMIICMYILQYQIIHITHTHIYICTDGVDKNQEPETTHNHHDPTTA
jgi:Ca2+/H+ antiporter